MRIGPVQLALAFNICLGLCNSSAIFSQEDKPGAPQNTASCSRVINHPTLIGYTLDSDDARCCHGPTGTERAFVVDVTTHKSVEIGASLTWDKRITQFVGWLPCRQVAVIGMGTLGARAQPAIPQCGASRCYEPASPFNAYFVDIATGKYWSPVWTAGPFKDLGIQNYGIQPIYKENKLQGYYLVADGTLLTMLPDGTGKTKTQVPADGHGCSFAKDLIACQVKSALKVFDEHFAEVATVKSSLTMPYGIWSPSGEGLLYFDGLRPGPHYVTYWSVKDKQSYRLGANADYDLDCEINGNCPGFTWGTEGPAWSQDGKRAYFTLPDPNDRLKRILGWVDITTPESRAIFHPLTSKFGRTARYPTVSPDGKSVAFLSVSDNPNEGRIQLFVVHLPNGQPEQVTHAPKGLMVSNPSWR